MGQVQCVEEYHMHEKYIKKSIELAQQASLEDEVPVGAVIVYKDKIISCGSNKREQLQDPLAHAEILAIKAAADHLSSWRLEECTLYVTLEPCPMCLGAAVNSRIKRIIFGAYDPKAGACGSVMDFSSHPKLNHSIEVIGGVLENECGKLLADFFCEKRKNKKKC